MRLRPLANLVFDFGAGTEFYRKVRMEFRQDVVSLAKRRCDRWYYGDTKLGAYDI